jgi:hypothetical protein
MSTHFIILHWIILIISEPLFRILLLSPPPQVSYILLSTLFSHTLNQCPSVEKSDKLSCPYRTAGKFSIIYILASTLLDIRKENKRF